MKLQQQAAALLAEYVGRRGARVGANIPAYEPGRPWREAIPRAATARSADGILCPKYSFSASLSTSAARLFM
jgi:hypothetical protein